MCKSAPQRARGQARAPLLLLVRLEVQGARIAQHAAQPSSARLACGLRLRSSALLLSAAQAKRENGAQSKQRAHSCAHAPEAIGATG